MDKKAKSGKKGRKYGRNKKNVTQTPMSLYVRGKISYETYLKRVKL